MLSRLGVNIGPPKRRILPTRRKGEQAQVAMRWELGGVLRSARGLAVEIAESTGIDEKCGYERMASQLEEWAGTAAATEEADECESQRQWFWCWANIYVVINYKRAINYSVVTGPCHSVVTGPPRARTAGLLLPSLLLPSLHTPGRAPFT